MRLLALIRQVLAYDPFTGEGYRKVHARLRREHGVRVGRKRVLRLMRAHDLLAPQRTRGRRKPRPHDGTIVPDAPEVMSGIDITMAYTTEDGRVWRVAVRHHRPPKRGPTSPLAGTASPRWESGRTAQTGHPRKLDIAVACLHTNRAQSAGSTGTSTWVLLTGEINLP